MDDRAHRWTPEQERLIALRLNQEQYGCEFQVKKPCPSCGHGTTECGRRVVAIVIADAGDDDTYWCDKGYCSEHAPHDAIPLGDLSCPHV